MRLFWLTLALAGIVLAIFFVWGENFERWLTGDAAVHWIRSCGSWGALAVIGLLVSDLFLPLPATPLMAAAGYVYGPWVGGTISAVGNFLAGTLAYTLCTTLGRRAAERIVRPDDLQKGERLFRANGAWLVALSRSLPILPEVIACLAGLTRMPIRTFFLALASGAIPTGFAYAAIGASGREQPALALALSAGVPLLLWFAVKRWAGHPAPPPGRA